MKLKCKYGYVDYNINDDIVIDNIGEVVDLGKLIERFVACNASRGKDIINKSKIDLKNHHFVNNVLKRDAYIIKRLVRIGKLETGENNTITDVKGVTVGHKSVNEGNYHTGVTVIKPHQGNVFRDKVVASSYSFNGFGKSIGFVQIEELGTIETNIVFTSTMNVGKIADGVIEEALAKNPEIGKTTGTINPIVMECNDGGLNKSRDRILEKQDYFDALKNASTYFKQGNVGAGCGMVCHGFKGGIGSSSRRVKIEDKEYTLGVILNSNFGSSNGEDLIINGKKFKDIEKDDLLMDEKGSIVVCLATDAPLNERQIKRLLKRVEIGIGRTGSFAGNGSGDVFVGFSTKNRRSHFDSLVESDIKYFSDDKINPLFRATVEATEEAVLNSLLFASSVKGYRASVESLGEESYKFADMIDEEIIWK